MKTFEFSSAEQAKLVENLLVVKRISFYTRITKTKRYGIRYTITLLNPDDA